ncbi:MAG: Vms1/Ankzf1 family peptidyl-tRNA hydrolase [Candidatus Aenigmatarchaeota archaeon]
MSLTDKIFGREELKERISFLEDKIQSLKKDKKELERKAEKESKRAKGAVSEKQELDRKIKKKEDKLASLQDKLKKKEFLEDKTSQVREKSLVGKEKMRGLVRKLGSMESSKEDMVTVFLPKGSSVNDINSHGFLQTNLTLNQLRRLKEESSETGMVLFHAENLLNLLMKPPAPVAREDWFKGTGFETEPVLEKLKEEVGFIFLSAGGSAVALFSDEIQEFQIVKSKIKGKHKKGGFSQGRFERGREEEVKKHVEKVVKACDDVLPEEIDWIALGGSPEMISDFKEREVFEDKKLFERKLDVSSIEDKGALKRAFNKFWKSELIHL